MTLTTLPSAARMTPSMSWMKTCCSPFLRAGVQNLLRLILFHRGGFVAMRKADHGSDEDIGPAQQVHGQRDVVWLYGEGGRPQPGRGLAKLDHLGPRRIGLDDRMVE